MFAIKLAKSRSAHVSVTTSAKNRALVESLGADEVIDYKTQNFVETLSDIDVVFDTLGGDIQESSWSVLKKAASWFRSSINHQIEKQTNWVFEAHSFSSNRMLTFLGSWPN
ncbi:MAG: NADPH:quinone reductase-like Zn-dependent oxidoreductase [Urechidicola sp.]|jgi:NADPH:quinone reductase-like Zn-dependent oxidoreductase